MFLWLSAVKIEKILSLNLLWINMYIHFIITIISVSLRHNVSLIHDPFSDIYISLDCNVSIWIIVDFLIWDTDVNHVIIVNTSKTWCFQNICTFYNCICLMVTNIFLCNINVYLYFRKLVFGLRQSFAKHLNKTNIYWEVFLAFIIYSNRINFKAKSKVSNW